MLAVYHPGRTLKFFSTVWPRGWPWRPVDVDTFRSAMGYTPRVLTVETVALLMRLHCLLLKRVGVAQMDQRLVAVQYTSMCAGQQRGKHFDKHDQGDIILTT